MLRLLDVNFMLGLAWPNHEFHRAATERMETFDGPWATCALTQIAFVRISCNPAFHKPAKLPGEAVRLLTEMTHDPGHVFIGEMGALSDLAFWSQVHGHQQVTDAYLVHLAEANNAILLTFDARLRPLAKPEHIEIVVPG